MTEKEAFEKIKGILVGFMSDPACLHHVRWDRTLYAESDASEYSIAGWAWQYSKSDKEMERIPKAQWPEYVRPVAYVSRRLWKHERAWNKPCGSTPGYTGAAVVQELLADPAKAADVSAGQGILHRECLAALYLLESIEDWVDGCRRTVLRTDHKHITFLATSTSTRTVRWALRFASFARLQFAFTSGKQLLTADALSRVIDMADDTHAPLTAAKRQRASAAERSQSGTACPLLLSASRPRKLQRPSLPPTPASLADSVLRPLDESILGKAPRQDPWYQPLSIGAGSLAEAVMRPRTNPRMALQEQSQEVAHAYVTLAHALRQTSNSGGDASVEQIDWQPLTPWRHWQVPSSAQRAC